eukprot:m.46784 g.46784  ORF g.46784 m.46784 type:complete len:54 (-) comp10941_c0_seq3:1658-1819(-)
MTMSHVTSHRMLQSQVYYVNVRYNVLSGVRIQVFFASVGLLSLCVFSLARVYH